ncbi:spore germination protein [Cytobacillus oceanisediminis]|uniref:Spore germination protein n=1 Tax=Niallia alba TaxID=2729105 RepID=A0A7Y0PKX8_9BACI|nr:spore germination protein [Cytobacillus oceanisediminis]NMO76323.1 spore germination protein [Niallia alba]
MKHNISNPNLVSDEIELGERVKQKVRIVYLNDIVDPELVTSIKDRLNNIDIDHFSVTVTPRKILFHIDVTQSITSNT